MEAPKKGRRPVVGGRPGHGSAATKRRASLPLVHDRIKRFDNVSCCTGCVALCHKVTLPDTSGDGAIRHGYIPDSASGWSAWILA